MNKKILCRSGIISLIALFFFFFLCYWYPDAVGYIKASFLFFSGIFSIGNWARWTGVYGRSHPGANEWRPHFAEDSPDANALCFNAFKWGVSMFLFVFL